MSAFFNLSSVLGCIVPLNVLDLEIFLDLWQKIPSPANTLLGFNHLTICEYIPQIAFAGSGSMW
jgi:hypothetical protein